MREKRQPEWARGLKRAGVELLDPGQIRLRCLACSQVWSPNLMPGGKLPRGWRLCPNGCNRTRER